MKLADFSLREREDKRKYMMVLRILNKTKKDEFVTLPAQTITTMSRSNSEPISSVTMSAADSSITSGPVKKAKIIRSTATAILIRNDCGISLCPRTIQKKVKAGKTGCWPLRSGPKGNIPELHYKNLCAY